MGRTRRVNVTLSYPMEAALRVLAERNGMHLTTQAMVLLRHALDATLKTEEVKRQVRVHAAGRTAAEWRQETADEHMVEVLHAKVGEVAQ